MARLALTDADKAVRIWYIQQAESLGCKITIDQMGNIFAVRPGKNSTAPPVMMGSHLDLSLLEEDMMEYLVCWLV
jgi:putative aminopeptidase FrvX